MTPRIILLAVCLLISSCTPEKMLSDEDPWTKIFEEHEVIQLKKHHMRLVAAGTPAGDESEQFALHYIHFKKVKIPQARKIVVQCVEDFLQIVNNSESIAPRLAKHPITYRDIKFNIGFATTDGDFQAPPYVAYAYLDDGNIYYCYHDELFGDFTEEEDVQEPYEEALANTR